MKTIRNLLLMLILMVSVNVFSQDYKTTHISIDKVWGIDFPCLRSNLIKALKEKGLDNHQIKYDNKAKVFELSNINVDGQYFDTALLRMYDGSILFQVQLLAFFKRKDVDSALSSLSTLRDKLTRQYGTPITFKSDEYTFVWIDNEENTIQLAVVEIKGEDEPYLILDLEYINDEYAQKHSEYLLSSEANNNKQTQAQQQPQLQQRSAPTNLLVKNINGSDIISLSFINLVHMAEMPLTEWTELLNKYYYNNEGLEDDHVLYSSGLDAYLNHVGGQFFKKSFSGPEVEYSLLYDNAHPKLKEDLVEFISDITPHYIGTTNTWKSYMLKYNSLIYEIGVLTVTGRTRIIFRRVDE